MDDGTTFGGVFSVGLSVYPRKYALRSMKNIEGEFNGVGQVRIFYRAWLPDAAPKAVVLLSHGVAEHSGRYAHVAGRLASAGYAVYAVDHRGHGRSGGKRSLVDRFDHAVEDLNQLYALARDAHPEGRVFLIGHSMGGAIAALYALTYQDQLAGLVLSAPALVVEGVSPILHRVATLLSAIAPGAGIVQLDAKAVSRDPVVVREYETDPLNFHGKVPARTAVELVKLAGEAPSRLRELRLPILVVQGTADGLVPPRAGRLVVDSVTSPDKTLRMYDGLYHEVFNEPEKDLVLDEVVEWLDQHAD